MRTVATVLIPAGTPAGAHALVATDAEGAELARADLAVTAAATAAGGALATTGAEGMTWLAVAVGALALSALGAGLWRRRRS